jgi:hypothetical protein
MRSIFNGILITTITMTFAIWILSSVILKTTQKSKSSSSVNSESITGKIRNGTNSMSHVKSNTSSSSYAQAPRRTYSRGRKTEFQKISSPFGAKLNLRANPNPFAPKLSLRGRKSQEWGRKRKTETQQIQEHYQQTNSSTNSSSKNTSSSPIISGYQNYVDILNEQMKD